MFEDAPAGLPPTPQPQRGPAPGAPLPPLGTLPGGEKEVEPTIPIMEPPHRMEQSSGRGRRIILIVIVVLVLLGAGVVAAAFLFPRSNENANTTSNVNSVANTNLNQNANRTTNLNTNATNTNTAGNLNTSNANVSSNLNTNTTTNTNTPPTSYGVDTDGDSLNNYLEEWMGTNPNNADSDSDGFPDGGEVTGSFSPLGTGTLNVSDLKQHCTQSRTVTQYALPSTDVTTFCGIPGNLLTNIQVMATNASFYEDLQTQLTTSCAAFGKIEAATCESLSTFILLDYATTEK